MSYADLLSLLLLINFIRGLAFWVQLVYVRHKFTPWWRHALGWLLTSYSHELLCITKSHPLLSRSLQKISFMSSEKTFAEHQDHHQRITLMPHFHLKSSCEPQPQSNRNMGRWWLDEVTGLRYGHQRAVVENNLSTILKYFYWSISIFCCFLMAALNCRAQL